MGLSREELAEFVARSCERQGVPVKVTDAAVVGRMAALLGAGADGGGAKPAPAAPARSELPDDLDAVRVEHSGAGCAGTDHGMVDDRADDGRLAGQVEVRPPAA